MANNFVMVATPSYDDVFCAPKTTSRESGRFYGKTLLEKSFKPQHSVHLENYRIVRGWFKEFACPSDLRHRPDDQARVKEIIAKNHHQIKLLKFEGAEYKWTEKDIYEWWVASNQSKRKYAKKKSNSTSTNVEENSVAERSLNDIVQEVEQDLKVNKNSSEKISLLDIVEEGDNNMQIEETIIEETSMKDLTPEGEDNMEEFDLDMCYNAILDGTQFPFGFTRLLESGINSKRVRATPNSFCKEITQKMMDDFKVLGEEPLQVRKSKRERKISKKMKESVSNERTSKNSLVKQKRLKDINNKSDANINCSEMSKVENHINAHTTEEKETILLKYFEVKTIDDMYLVLKASYNKIVKDEKLLKVNEKHLTLEQMRENLVAWLFASGKILLHKQDGHDLTLDEVEILF